MRLYLFSQFRMEGAAQRVRLSAAKKLIALLCLREGTTWEREHIALNIWPSAGGAEARERLRTTLADARRALGDHVSWGGGRNALELIPEGLQVDLWEARAEWRKIGVASDATAEYEASSRFVDLTEGTLLPEMPDFLSSEREQWGRRTIEAIVRIAAMEEERGNLEAASRCLERSLPISPYHERVWRDLIRVEASLGRHVEICDRFARVRQELRKTLGSDFSSSLRQLAQHVKRSGHSATGLTLDQADMIARTVSRQLETAPHRAADLLGSQEFRLEIFRSPVKAAEMLERVLNSTSGGSPSRMQCAVYAMMAHTVIGRDDRLIALGKEVTTFDHDPARLRAAETMLAGTYLNHGQFDLALASYERALVHAIAVGNTPGIDLVIALRAVIEWELGQATETLAVLTEIEGRLAQYSEHNARVGRASVVGYMGFVHLYANNVEDAKRCFEQSAAYARDSGHSSGVTIIQPGLGLSQILLGSTASGSDLLRRGLAELHRLRSDRLTLRAIDFCARGLIHLGRANEATWLLDQSEAMRQNANIANSPLHQTFCAQARSLAGEDHAATSRSDVTSVRELVTVAIDLLT